MALLDKNLGDGSGLDVARALKAAKPDVEVILVTGYASLDSAIQAVQIGAYDYVTKPVSDYDALNLKVENATEKVRMKRRQRELVAQLVESEALHRGVFETSSDAILLVDAGDRPRSRTRTPPRSGCTARAREELRRLRFDDLADPEDGADPAPPDRRALGPGPPPARRRRAVPGGGLRGRARRARAPAPRPLGARRLRAGAGGGGAARARAEPPAGAEDGGGRAARGRHRPRLLEHARGHPRLRRTARAATCRAATRGCASRRTGSSRPRTARCGVTRQLLTLSRKKLLRPRCSR